MHRRGSGFRAKINNYNTHAGRRPITDGVLTLRTLSFHFIFYYAPTACVWIETSERFNGDRQHVGVWSGREEIGWVSVSSTAVAGNRWTRVNETVTDSTRRVGAERRNKIGLSYFCAFWVGGGRGFLLDNFRVDLTADTGRTWIFPRNCTTTEGRKPRVDTPRWQRNTNWIDALLAGPYLVPRSPATTTFHLLFDRFKSDVTRRLSCTRLSISFHRYGHCKNYGTEK